MMARSLAVNGAKKVYMYDTLSVQIFSVSYAIHLTLLRTVWGVASKHSRRQRLAIAEFSSLSSAMSGLKRACKLPWTLCLPTRVAILIS